MSEGISLAARPIVEVYRNLHRGCYSVRLAKLARYGALGGKVILHAEEVLLRDVKFIVSAAGREKVRREKKKYVHAWLKGRLIGFNYGSETQWTDAASERWDLVPCLVGSPVATVRYNPYQTLGFEAIGQPGEIVHEADTAVLGMQGVAITGGPINVA